MLRCFSSSFIHLPLWQNASQTSHGRPGYPIWPLSGQMSFLCLAVSSQCTYAPLRISQMPTNPSLRFMPLGAGSTKCILLKIMKYWMMRVKSHRLEFRSQIFQLSSTNSPLPKSLERVLVLMMTIIPLPRTSLLSTLLQMKTCSPNGKHQPSTHSFQVAPSSARCQRPLCLWTEETQSSGTLPAILHGPFPTEHNHTCHQHAYWRFTSNLWRISPLSWNLVVTQPVWCGRKAAWVLVKR